MSEKSKSGRPLKWAGGVLAAFVLLLVLLAACLAFLQTDTAREKLAAVLSSALSMDSDARVVFSKPEGLLPFHARFERITVGDGGGTWLSAEKVDLKWSPLALLLARLEIEELAASEVRLERLPAGPPEGEDRESEPFSFPEKLPSVTLERLSIAELHLGKAVLGEAGSFELDGSVSTAHLERGITASLHLARKDGPETRMDARIGYRASDGRLDAKLDFHEAAGGWTAGVLGWGDAGGIDVSLDGSGPIEEWKGALSGNVQGFGSINTDIFVRAGKGMEAGKVAAFGIHGAYLPAAAPPSSSPAMRALQSGARFGIDASISEARTMTMEKAEFIGEDFHLAASGRIDLESLDTEGAWELEAAGLERFEPLMGVPVAGKLSGRGTVSSSGPESARGTLEVNLRDFKLDRVQSDKIEARLSFEPLPMPDASSGWGFKVVGNGSAEEIVLAAAEKFPERAFQWSFDMDIREKGPVSIAALEVLGKSLSIELRGEVDPKDLTGTVDATVHAKDTGQLGALLGQNLPSEAKLGVHLTGDGRALDASAHLDGRLSGMERFPDSIAPLLSPEVAIEGDIELLRGKEVKISSVRVRNEVFQLDAEALMNFDAESMKGSWKLSLLKPAALGTALQRDLSGALEAKGGIEGSFTALRFSAALAGNEIILDGRKLRRVGAELLAENIPAGPRGSFRLEVKQDGMDFLASTGLALDGHRLELARLSAKAGANEIKGELVLDLEKKLAEGSLEGRMDDLADLGRIIGGPLGGSARFKARLAHGKAGPGPGQGQDAEVSARAESLRTRLGTVKEAAFSADLHHIGEALRGDASLELRQAEISGTVLDRFNLKGSAKGGAGKFEISARGRSAEKFDVEAGGTFALSKDAERVRIETLGGRFGHYPLKLVAPAAFRRSGKDLSLEELSLSLGAANLKASGSIDPNRVRMDLDLRGLPLDMLASLGAPDLTGTAAGKLGLGGSPSNPSGRIQLSLIDVRKKTSALRDLPAAAVSVEAGLEGGRLNSTARIEGILKEPATADLSVPLSLSLSPIGYALPPQGSVRGRLKATADLATLIPLLAPEDHRASGNLEAGFNIGGTVADLRLEGGATISEGSYHNLTYGTVLKDLSARVVTQGDRLVLEELRATDGEKGRIRAEGWIELDASDRFPMAIELGFSDAGLIRRDDVTGSLGGSLRIAGSFRDMAMDGKLAIGSADVLLPRRISQPLAELHVVEINAPEGKAEPPKPSRQPSATIIRMDLAVSSPGRIIVHGHNLNSEWKGDIRLSGTTDKPAIVGALTLVRGQYTFLDKPFRLLEGTIQFYGSSPPRPTLRVVAESKAKDITARLLLTGPVSDPKVELESEPPLPSDEILSRILFGRSLSTVTPLQAGKLALALRSLSGKGDTLDFLDRARKRLGVDQLELRDVQDGTALGIGKYLTQDVYVDVEKGLGNEPGKVSVQVELTPSIMLETEAGTDASKGIQLEWKHDY